MMRHIRRGVHSRAAGSASPGQVSCRLLIVEPGVAEMREERAPALVSVGVHIAGRVENHAFHAGINVVSASIAREDEGVILIDIRLTRGQCVAGTQVRWRRARAGPTAVRALGTVIPIEPNTPRAAPV